MLLTLQRYNDCRRVPPSEDEEVAADEVPCQPSAFVSVSIHVEIVGFVRPDDPGDLRWQLFQDGWAGPQDPLPEGQGRMPLLTSGEYYFGALTRQLPELVSRHRSGIVPDLEALAVR